VHRRPVQQKEGDIACNEGSSDVARLVATRSVNRQELHGAALVLTTKSVIFCVNANTLMMKPSKLALPIRMAEKARL
jgi:hypothetical protein